MDSFSRDDQAETSAADGKALASTGTKLFSEPWKQSALNMTFSVASSCMSKNKKQNRARAEDRITFDSPGLDNERCPGTVEWVAPGV